VRVIVDGGGAPEKENKYTVASLYKTKRIEWESIHIQCTDRQY